MEELLIPIDNIDYEIVKQVANRFDEKVSKYITEVDEKEYIKYNDLFIMIENLVDELDRVKEEKDEIAQELFMIGR